MLSDARDRSQPCVRLTQIGVKGRGLDVIDAPAVAKDRPDLGLSSAPRSPIARFLVAEALQKVGAAPPNDSPEAISEVGAVFVREHMKQPGINDGVEWLLGHGEVERVGELETSRETTPFCLARAFLIAVGAPSIPAATKPCSARYRTFSPVPHPMSRTNPAIWPVSASSMIAGCERPMSHGGGPREAGLNKSAGMAGRPPNFDRGRPGG